MTSSGKFEGVDFSRTAKKLTPNLISMSDTLDTQKWYIVKRPIGHCEIVNNNVEENSEVTEKWGPFDSQGDAIARRIGLIRAGKCQPQ